MTGRGKWARYNDVIMSVMAQLRFKSPMLTQTFTQAQIKKNIKAWRREFPALGAITRKIFEFDDVII